MKRESVNKSCASKQGSLPARSSACCQENKSRKKKHKKTGKSGNGGNGSSPAIGSSEGKKYRKTVKKKTSDQVLVSPVR